MLLVLFRSDLKFVAVVRVAQGGSIEFEIDNLLLVVPDDTLRSPILVPVAELILVSGLELSIRHRL